MNLKTTFKNQITGVRKSLLSNNFAGLMWYYQQVWTPKVGSLDAFLEDYFKNQGDDVFFMQVGGNDGFQNDPICKFVKRHRWQGITIEPQKKAFQSLKAIYKNDKVTPINAAIDAKNDTRKLYKVAFTDARWASGISSFLKKHLEDKIKDGYIEGKAKKSGIPLPKNQADWITYDEIDCLTFDSIFDTQTVSKIDLLQIDTEGFDFEIIKLFNFDRILPQVIIFESENLSTTDLADCKALLSAKGYQFKNFVGDTLAWLV